MDENRVAFCPFCGQRISHVARFYVSCGRSLEFLREMNGNEMEKTNVLHQCIQYFNEDHSYAVIICTRCRHQLEVSQKPTEWRFYSRKDYSSTNAIIRTIRLELRGPGQLFGYRTMWQVLKQKYNLNHRTVQGPFGRQDSKWHKLHFICMPAAVKTYFPLFSLWLYKFLRTSF